MIIENIILLYIATFVVFYAHELGHLGDKIVVKKLLPLPSMFSYQARTRYGGLFVNVLLFVSIAHFKPEMFIFLLIGAISWIHFIIYSILGSFNKELKVPPELWEYVVFDDVPNRLWWIFVPAGIIAFIFYKDFYILVFQSLIS